MIKFFTLNNLIALVNGVLVSIVASFLISLFQESPPILTFMLLIALLFSIGSVIAFYNKLRILRIIGIKDWESSPTEQTNTKSCILKSQTKLRFFGITGNKWLKEESELIKMFIRHSSNGGSAEFLLLDPNSEACTYIQRAKSGIEGNLNLREDIIRNSRKLLEFSKSYQVTVKYYSNKARFRVAIIDDDEIIVGLYSYTSLQGKEETPQLILKNQHENWSFYYGFNAYFQNAWENATEAKDFLAPPDEQLYK